ncbi:MAG: 2Fe-2S iron-sulfur cluster-binding protein [Pyrinomonadaceae bacterium]
MNSESYGNLFEPFEELVEIEIEGEKYRVPENNLLLRCFQFISVETVSYGNFCWNGDCANCRVWLEDEQQEKPVLACCTRVEDGMKIVKLADEIGI